MPRAASGSDALTAKEELFVAHFIAHGNGADAARSAGYSAKRAAPTAVELLARPRVAKAIQAARTRITKKHHLTAERIVEEIAVIAFSDPRHYRFDDDGYVVLAPGAPESAMRAVKKIKRKLRIIPQKGSKPPIRDVESEFELWSKDTELRNGGDYLKLFKENRASDDEPDESLTLEQLKDRIIGLLATAAKRRKQQTSSKRGR